MIRNLKALGLALVAAFAMSAVTTSVASAQQGTLTSDGPVTLKTNELGIAGETLGQCSPDPMLSNAQEARKPFSQGIKC